MFKYKTQVLKLKLLTLFLLSFFILHSSLLIKSVSAQVDPNLNQRLDQEPIIVDHNSVALFDQIPEIYINRAKNIRMVFSDRSVGSNINDYLNCLQTPSAQAVTSCKRNHSDPLYQVDPSVLTWTGSYDRTNWVFEYRAGEWYVLTQNYVEDLFPNFSSTNDIVTFQFSYLNVNGASSDRGSIANTQCGFLAIGDRTSCPTYLREWSVDQIKSLEDQNPNKVFIYWTSSLARGIGTSSSLDFNNQMRNHARSNNKILFDMADIISHTPDGTACFDNRDGISYNSENYPDDNIDLPAICQHYTSETDGGHLGSPAAGGIRTAQAYWVLMAQIAGWQPDGRSPTILPTATLTPTIPNLIPGDADANGRVDGVDYVIWLNHYNQEVVYGQGDGDFNSSGVVDGVDYVIWLNNYGV